MDTIYVCTEIQNTPYGVICVNWVQTVYYGGFKLTYEQMGEFILAVALIHATVFAVKVVKRSFL